MEPTIQYYENNAASFAEGTKTVDFTVIQNIFMDFLPRGGCVLDFGCGSGRDAKYFLEHGFSVEAIDGSIELCRIASEYTGIEVRHMFFRELSECEKYDGIWACASILHLKRQEIPEVLEKMITATKPGGIIYLSFKYGDFEGERNGRYFTDMTESSMEELLLQFPTIMVEKQWISGDVRKDRGDERWLNMILRKEKGGQ